jgi:cytochrome c553
VIKNFVTVLGVVALTSVAVPSEAREDFDLEKEVKVCASCHGESGIPVAPDYPIIWGQEYFYVLTQLRDYAAGRRQHEIMTGIASKYSRKQATLLAEHFSKLAWPYVFNEAKEGDREISEVASSAGQCNACHGRWGGNSNVPRVAGQQTGYLEKTMLDFKNERRLNAPDKISTMSKSDDDTIAALARHLASVRLLTGQ